MIEIMMCVLNNGVSSARFRALDAVLQTTFYYQQPGLQRRTLAGSTDGNWVVITYWDSVRDADEAAAALADNRELSEAWSRAVDQSSVRTMRYTE